MPRPSAARITPSRGSSETPAAADDPALLALRRFRQVFNAVRSHFRAVENAAGLAGAQVWALGVVAERPGLGVGDLARAMDIRPATASNLLRRLVAGGFVATARDAADRRTARLRLTPAGARVLKRAPQPAGGVLPAALRQLDAGTLCRLNDDLACLIEALDADPRGARVPIGNG